MQRWRFVNRVGEVADFRLRNAEWRSLIGFSQGDLGIANCQLRNRNRAKRASKAAVVSAVSAESRLDALRQRTLQ